ncbi:ABC transporter ATP-binding protein [Anaerocolumna aminovalerica]|uniref:Energy-coupling factor transport system ATP-binding protein n=1 Tax=Anaerocolumna aminovalerica TaxID=1527 RepID=A0A1I5EF55_9FIRM|nr:ABC transporter ATP-binding protein [Anaerocolumna aminovalerica]SFO10010.1 energy-coupling factor transport system ATP-binding protein [Anaerocolumna aminovalerica]
MKKPVIEFTDYSFKYRTQKEPTLHNINLTIMEGEKVLIVGPSGSGKSTLAHCMNGLVPFSYTGESTGTLKVGGKDASKSSIFELSKDVGTVLQDPDGQFIGLTVGEDIAFSLENACVPLNQMKEKVLEAAKIVGVDSLLSHSPQDLSGGQKQRVSMAGAMTNDVNILLFDEPLANLDPATGKYAIELIDEIHKSTKKTIVIIEHRLEDVLYKNVDRIILVCDGRIKADLNPDKLLTTDLLQQEGIREPLYITAMKYAGCHVREEDSPSNLDNMNIAPYKEQISQWFSSRIEPLAAEKREALLEIKDISFSYQKGEEVLKKVSFTVYKGDMLSIVGRNGAGKSTLSKLICGFQTPDKGQILYQGNDLAGYSIKKRAEKIGLVMQNPNQMISKPMIYDEVALGLAARGVPEEEIRPRVEETLKICGLFPFRNWPIAALSFGQKKRVTIASILVLNPQIIILDEPTAGQDFRHYTEIMEFLREMNEKVGITIIMITHDMHLMLEYTSRCVVISDGTLISDSTGAKVLTDSSIIQSASLKETSLYELSMKCGIEKQDGSAFVQHFIEYDKGVRTRG